MKFEERVREEEKKTNRVKTSHDLIFFRVLFSCRFLFHIFIIIIIVSLAIVFAMRARYGFNSN